jgi:hypothetical protein
MMEATAKRNLLDNSFSGRPSRAVRNCIPAVCLRSGTEAPVEKCHRAA